MNEAMGLAGFNPMVGSINNGRNMMINSLSNDKDLTDGWGNFSISNNISKNKNSLIIDKNGKLNLVNNKELYSGSKISIYSIVDEECNKRITEIVRELSMDYENRPVHDQNYLYEAVTGHKLITKDQPDFDDHLQRIELDKTSKVLNNFNNDNSYEIFPKKVGYYKPDQIIESALYTLDSLIEED